MHVCVRQCDRIQPSGKGLTRTRQGVSAGSITGELKYLVGGSLRPTDKKLGCKLLLGRVHGDRLGSGEAEGLGGRPPALVRPSSLAGGRGRPLELQLEGPAALHGVINLLTQGSAGTLWRVTGAWPANQLTH